jgi:hypothetical protein
VIPQKKTFEIIDRFAFVVGVEDGYNKHQPHLCAFESLMQHVWA